MTRSRARLLPSAPLTNATAAFTSRSTSDAGTRFPWGDEIPQENVCWRKPEGAPPCEVGASSVDVTSTQIFDLVANATEWTARDPDASARIVGVPRDRCNAPLLFLDLRQTIRRSVAEDDASVSGFRCVYPAGPTTPSQQP